MSQYLITFDMDTTCLKDHYHSNNPNNAYSDIRNVLQKYDFTNIQGSVYLGSPKVSEAHGTLALQELTAKYDWFGACVSNIKFYRIEADLDAQFIVDGVMAMKANFNKQLLELEKELESAGVTKAQISKIISNRKIQLLGNRES